MGEDATKLRELLRRLGKLRTVRAEVTVLPRGVRVRIWREGDDFMPDVYEGGARELSHDLERWFQRSGHN